MSGLSARLSAVVVVVLLGGVVALAMAGRKPSVQRAPFPIAAAVASPEPTPTAGSLPTPTTATRPGIGLPFHLPTTPINVRDQWPASAPTPPPGHLHWVLGEDGIFGLPGYPWRADDTHVTVTPAPARHFFNWMSGGPGHSYRR